MGVKIRYRNSAWWLYIDHQGARKAKRVGTGEGGKKAAKLAAQQIEARLALGQAAFASHKSGVTFETYANTFLHRIEHTRKHTTLADYNKILRRDLLPTFCGLDLQDITREKVKKMALDGLQKGQSPKTVQNIVRCLSSLLSHAMEDGLVAMNTALKPGKFLPKISKRGKIAPLTRSEVALMIETAKTKLPSYYPLFLCAVRTGLRLGELLALQWGDLDWHGRFIEVQRNYTHWQLTTPKGGENRRVDMSRELGEVLKDWQMEQQIEAAARGWEERPPWVFTSEVGGLLHPNNLRDRVFYGLLRKAGLRKVRFHDLRHTFASLLLQQGESLVYVKEQMGHSSIQVTVDLYGHLIPGGNKQAVDRLDTPRPKSFFEVDSATLAQPWPEAAPAASADFPKYPGVAKGTIGVSDGFRTRDLRIHNPAL